MEQKMQCSLQSHIPTKLEGGGGPVLTDCKVSQFRCACHSRSHSGFSSASPCVHSTAHPSRPAPCGSLRQLGDNGTIFSAGTRDAELRAAWLSANDNQGGPSFAAAFPQRVDIISAGIKDAPREHHSPGTGSTHIEPDQEIKLLPDQMCSTFQTHKGVHSCL